MCVGLELFGESTASIMESRGSWEHRDVLATIARGPPRALTNGSESQGGTLQRSSSVRSHSSEGSVTTNFVAPAADISKTASIVPYVPRETADDMSVVSLVLCPVC